MCDYSVLTLTVKILQAAKTVNNVILKPEDLFLRITFDKSLDIFYLEKNIM